MERLRFCVPSSGIAPDSASGGERYAHDLTVALAGGGDEPHLLLARHQAAGALEPYVERLRIGRGLRWPVMPFAMQPAIDRCWRHHAFDLLVAHSARYGGPACLWARRRLGVPVVVHAHHLDDDWLTPILERRVLRAADAVITDSRFARRQIINLGVPDERVHVVYCGAPDWAQPVARPERHTLTVLAVGPLIARKRPMVIVEAFAALPVALRNRAQLIFVGDGPLRSDVARRADALGLLGRVALLGYVPEDEKRQWYRRADLFVHASRLEGFPLAVLEAMATGLPVVAFKAASLPELITPQCGELVEDAESFTQSLQALLQDGEFRWTLGGNAARRVAEHFTWAQTVAQVRGVYQQTIARSAGALRGPRHGETTVGRPSVGGAGWRKERA